MDIKKWKEIQPMSCEVCDCCEYHQCFTDEKLMCKKYRKTVELGFWGAEGWDEKINSKYYKDLHEKCNCKKNYPSVLTRYNFFKKKISYYWKNFMTYIDDVRYHRFDD